jgi:hypothetical protein
MNANAYRIAWKTIGIVLAATIASLTASVALADGNGMLGRCTMAMPPTRATVEVEMANAPDFCELVSQALAGSVFRAPMIVTPGELWHYADAAQSCRLRYGANRSRMTVRNSAAACRWFARVAPNWHLEADTAALAG